MEDDGEKSSYVIGVIENRAKEVGVAAFDLRSASLHLSQYIETGSSYQNTKTLLHFYDPLVIIVPSSKLAPETMTGVSTIVDKYYSAAKKVIVARGCFDDTKVIFGHLEFHSKQNSSLIITSLEMTAMSSTSQGAVLVKHLAATEPSVLGLDTYYKQYYLCLAAAAATVKWLLFL